MRLNGWQRIGVVASVLWLVGGAIYERNRQLHVADLIFQGDMRLCLSTNAGKCFELAHQTYASLIALDATKISNILFFALAPVLAGWVLTYLIVKTFRWVKAGF